MTTKELTYLLCLVKTGKEQIKALTKEIKANRRTIAKEESAIHSEYEIQANKTILTNEDLYEVNAKKTNEIETLKTQTKVIQSLIDKHCKKWLRKFQIDELKENKQ